LFVENKYFYLSLSIIQAFVALGAIPVGFLMILKPDGSSLGMQLELLSNSPFPNFLIPGLFLFIVNGLCNLVGSILSFKKHKYSSKIGFLLGLILIMWISIQVYFITLNSFLQPLFFIIGLIEALLAFVLLKKEELIEK
jgi:hypothetical protein